MAIEKQLERSMPRSSHHFTQSAIYHKKSQQTDRSRKWASSTEHELTSLIKEKKDESGLKLTLRKICPTDDGFHEEEGVYEQSPSRAPLEDSPDNIVKRLIRKTSLSRDIHKTTYCRRLAEKITESMQPSPEKID